MKTDRAILEESLHERGYALGSEIGRGAFGVVMEATHHALGRRVAVKQLPRGFASDNVIRERFIAEARIIASIQHPHIVPVFDFFERDGVYALIMEYLTGGTLYQRFERRGLTEPQSCVAVLAATAALQHAHDRGVLHRDVKPDNLIYSDHNILKLADFGVAQLTQSRMTIDGSIFGTPAYMAPEQALGGELGPYTDVFACGVMLFELLSGHLPYPHEGSSIQTLVKRANTDAPAIRTVAPHLPEKLARAVDAALSRDPAARFQTAREFGMQLAIAATEAFGTKWIHSTDMALLGEAELLATTERGAAPLSRPTLVRPARATQQLNSGDVAGFAAEAPSAPATLAASAPLADRTPSLPPLPAALPDPPPPPVVPGAPATQIVVAAAPPPARAAQDAQFKTNDRPPEPPADAAPRAQGPREEHRRARLSMAVGVLAAIAAVTAIVVVTRRDGNGGSGALATSPAATVLGTSTSAATPSTTAPAGAPPSGAGMVEIPSGSYPVGAESPDLSESNRRTVNVKAFYLDASEVTNREYKAFVDQANGARPLPGVWNNAGPPANLLNHPVRGITYEWASAYCAALGKRLPTEIEWEVAAGGKEGLRYAWGNDLAAVNLPLDGTYEVKTQPQNKSPMGVFDLTGNVWEWVTDTYDTNKVKANERVLRGGQNGYVRTNWTRLPIQPGASGSVAVAGFRCAATAIDPKTPALAFGKYERPTDPSPPQIAVKPGFFAYDDFTDPSSGWIERTVVQWRFGYHPNKYFHLETKQPGQTVVALSPAGTPRGAKVSVSTAAEIEPTLTETGGQYEFGIVVRASDGPNGQPNGYVALVVNPRAQTWEAYIKTPNGARTRIDGRGIALSENRVISLRVDDYGDHLEFFINNLYGGQSKQGEVATQGGGTGFILSSNAESTKAHIHFSFFGIET